MSNDTPSNAFGKPIAEVFDDGIYMSRYMERRSVMDFLTAHGWTNIDGGAGLLWTHPRVKSVRTRITILDRHALEVQARWDADDRTIRAQESSS